MAPGFLNPPVGVCLHSPQIDGMLFIQISSSQSFLCPCARHAKTHSNIPVLLTEVISRVWNDRHSLSADTTGNLESKTKRNGSDSSKECLPDLESKPTTSEQPLIPSCEPYDVICLGLGSPSNSPNANAQLAFLMEVCHDIGIVGKLQLPRCINVHLSRCLPCPHIRSYLALHRMSPMLAWSLSIEPNFTEARTCRCIRPCVHGRRLITVQ